MAGRWELQVGGETKILEWPSAGDGNLARVRIDEREYAVHSQVVDRHQVLLQVDGRTVQAFVAEDGRGRYVFIAGEVYWVDKPEPNRKRKGRVGPEEILGEVTPPMPSVVVRLLVREGETVVKGQGLVVVSAMKMETTLKAPIDGVVRKINTALQAKVMPGDQLVEIEERQ
jgi:3-methylcrotonyl-CoA carboxylase alpha subunit